MKLVGLLLDSDLEVSTYITAITRQWPVNRNRGTMFSVWFMPRYYKQDKSVSGVSEELVGE
jgi:hypothetical protein